MQFGPTWSSELTIALFETWHRTRESVTTSWTSRKWRRTAARLLAAGGLRRRPRWQLRTGTCRRVHPAWSTTRPSRTTRRPCQRAWASRGRRWGSPVTPSLFSPSPTRPSPRRLGHGSLPSLTDYYFSSRRQPDNFSQHWLLILLDLWSDRKLSLSWAVTASDVYSIVTTVLRGVTVSLRSLSGDLRSQTFHRTSTHLRDRHCKKTGHQ